jgi:hypothetical protein
VLSFVGVFYGWKGPVRGTSLTGKLELFLSVFRVSPNTNTSEAEGPDGMGKLVSTRIVLPVCFCARSRRVSSRGSVSS